MRRLARIRSPRDPGLRFGVVQIVVHDSKVTQIERTEKISLPNLKADRHNQMNSIDQTTGSSQKPNTPTGLPEVRFK
ncbi:MAG: hypothetical protein DME32_04160 [Verrucomicrobia bacterium]|nr:MAG: hypothetical protein DME32_04160 [Verrucomicrobiota bacterium]